MIEPEDIVSVEHPTYEGGLYRIIFHDDNGGEYPVDMSKDDYNKLMWSMQLLIEGASESSIEHLIDAIERIIHEQHYEAADGGI